MCSFLEAETKSDSGEAKDNVCDQVFPEVLPLDCAVASSGKDTKSDSGEAKERDPVQTGRFCLEELEAVAMPLTSLALRSLMAF
mmetsp:Transcript_28003/g.65832  ORF Transcript_28003/g.65832 Transcript_28003/m.65832 type:complete len:84 (-) Transcript_28003:134-385(-)